MKPARFWIDNLNLEKHPEGGWYKEVYRSDDFFSKTDLPERYSAERNCSTSIYYLLENTDRSNFHKIKSDEIWHFYTGNSAIEIILIKKNEIQKLILGSDFINGERFQIVIPKNTWFAAHLTNIKGYALAGCTVSPGFDFDDFELANREDLQKEFPKQKSVINRFTVE